MTKNMEDNKANTKQIVLGKLEKLANSRAEIANMETTLDERIRDLIPDDVREKIDDLKSFYSDLLAREQATAALLELDVKRYAEAYGETIKSDRIMAVYNKPRVTYDVSGLDGYAVANPAVLAFRKEGKPSITIREVKGK